MVVIAYRRLEGAEEELVGEVGDAAAAEIS